MLVLVLALLVVMSTLVPLMVLYTQRESRWSEKQTQSTTAFHLAESGIEKGYRAISLSTATWYALTDNGTQITDFKFDKAFTDVPGGSYTVSITSGPEEREATVISVGRVTKGSRSVVRAVKAVFAQFSDDIAVQSLGGVNVNGKVDVEWGAVISERDINTDGRTYPIFKSAADIVDRDSDGEGGVNCDQPNCCQWFSYNQDVPKDPGINLGQYRTDANAIGRLYVGDQSWKNTDYTGGGTTYVEGNLTLAQTLNIVGNLIITGNLNVPNGVWGSGSVDMTVPQTAWKQYCNNWSYYKTTFEPANAYSAYSYVPSGYKSAATLNYQPTQNKTAVQGFLYVGGNISGSGSGSGNTRIFGSVFVVGSVTLGSNSNVTVYYDRVAAKEVKTLRLNLRRESWQSLLRDWPL